MPGTPRKKQHDRLALIQQIFDSSAGRYERDIVPLLAPLANDLIAYVRPHKPDRVLDIGTGTGIAARLIAPHVRSVAALDLSRASLRAARHVPTPAEVGYVQGDLHDSPFPPNTFSLMISSFGLNSTDPQASLPVLWRLAAPGGRLVLQEWGPRTPYDNLLADTLDEFALDEPGEPLQTLRDQLDAYPARWSMQLQDTDDYREQLEEVGFRVEHTAEYAPVRLRLDSTETYLTFRFAWTQRYEEIRAMDGERRAAFYEAARARIAPFAEPDGSLIWQPILFRVTARA